VKDGLTLEQVRYNMKHSLGTGKQLPQTFIVRINGKTAGMYQLSMSDDLQSRPDLYPWLINVYVDEEVRGKGVCREMMKTVAENAKGAGLEH
jgi:N-acetylglutamate synthase-like GNAT family acetyltransferase